MAKIFRHFNHRKNGEKFFHLFSPILPLGANKMHIGGKTARATDLLLDITKDRAVNTATTPRAIHQFEI
jgi:hypothetical protein